MFTWPRLMDRVSQRVRIVNAIIHVAWTNVASSRAFISTKPRLIAIEGENSSIPFYFISRLAIANLSFRFRVLEGGEEEEFANDDLILSYIYIYQIYRITLLIIL